MKKYLTEREMHKDFLLKDGDYVSTKEMLERVAKYVPNNNIFAELDKDKNIIYHTAQDVLNDVENLGDGLISLGLENKHIVICAENSYLYVISDLSISGGVGVVTPIDKDAPEELLKTLLNKCDANAIICSSYVLDKINNILNYCPLLEVIITIDKKVDDLPYIKDIMELGKQETHKGKYRSKELDLSAPAKLLFTSGTTGANKCVVLSQNNLAANMINCMDMIKAEDGEENTSMSILPMHHATEINTHIMGRIAAGRLTYICDSMKNLMPCMNIFKPRIITVVPMIANAFYQNIWLNAKRNGLTEKLKGAIELSKSLLAQGIDKRDEIFKDVYAPFGGNLREIVVGGAMLNPEVVKGLRDFGIYIVNGYGITECGPLISMNADTLSEVYSVGKCCPGLTVKLENINEDGVGELCVKGKSVSLGYYKDEEATKKVFKEDGYFNTGDLARIDENGLIFLTGRKKNSIVLPNGKNISPEEIETEIQNNLPYAKDIVVYIAKHNNNSILCVGLYIDDLTLKYNKEKIKFDIQKVNRTLPNYKQIQFINLSENEYIKTSTRKIKRDTVLNNHNFETGIKL